MPFARKTLSELRVDVAQDLRTGIPGADGLLRFSNLKVFGAIQAGMAHLHYGYLDWIARMAVPFTAEDEFLDGWAALKKIIRKPPAAAVITAIFTGSSGTIPAGTLIARGDGAQYTVNADATVSAGSVTATATAVVPGAAGDCDPGTAVTLGSAIAGIQANGVTGLEVTSGADMETNDQLRSRMLQRYAQPPLGGGQSDYVTWALEVAGVTRAWTAPVPFGPGTVAVYFMMDVTEAAHNGFPQGTDGVAALETRDVAATGDQLTVANYIFARRPVTALVYAVTPIATPIAFTIHNISGASAAVKAAIAAAIAEVFVLTATPGGIVDLDVVEVAIAAIAGTSGFVITLPADNVPLAVGHLPTVGVITYT